MMKALYFDKPGKKGKSLYGDVPKLTEKDLKPDQILVRVQGAALNGVDIGISMGAAPGFMNSPSRVFGFDFCGVVEAVKEGKHDFKVGETVYGMTNWTERATCAEYLVVTASFCSRAPKGLSPTDAASLGMSSLTSMCAFRICGLKENDPDGKKPRVLILGGAGGVGTVALQLAKGLYNASFLATTASKGKKTELCKDLGADLVIDYHDDKEVEKLGELDPFDVCFDLSGELPKYMKFIKKGGAATAANGTVTAEAIKNYGKEGHAKLGFVFSAMIATSFGRRTLNKYALKSYSTVKALHEKNISYDYTMVHPSGTDLAIIAEQVEKNQLKAVVQEVFELSDGLKALEQVMSGKAWGKICLKIEDL